MLTTKLCMLVVEFSAHMHHTGAYSSSEGSSSQAITSARCYIQVSGLTNQILQLQFENVYLFVLWLSRSYLNPKNHNQDHNPQNPRPVQTPTLRYFTCSPRSRIYFGKCTIKHSALCIMSQEERQLKPEEYTHSGFSLGFRSTFR